MLRQATVNIPVIELQLHLAISSLLLALPDPSGRLLENA